jgi:MFS family permease
MIMKKIGRKATFMAVALYAAVVALLAAYSVYQSHFYLFCLSTFLLGFSNATLLQYRFAAMESVHPDWLSRAASFVLIGGIASAFIGPEVAVWGKDLLEVPFAGSYLTLVGLNIGGLLLLLFYKNTLINTSENDDPQRTLVEIIRQPVFWTAVLGATVGYAVMTFIMTATPVSMHVMDGHSLEHTKWVIQSHIVAMYLPSVITGWLIKKLGIFRLMIAGLIIYIGCLIFALSGHAIHQYFIALVLLGVGWNFLFVGGTALLPQAYRNAERFKVQGLNELIIFSTQAIASLSSGWIVFTLGWEMMLLTTIPVIGLQFVMLWIWKRSSTSM